MMHVGMMSCAAVKTLNRTLKKKKNKIVSVHYEGSDIPKKSSNKCAANKTDMRKRHAAAALKFPWSVRDLGATWP